MASIIFIKTSGKISYGGGIVKTTLGGTVVLIVVAVTHVIWLMSQKYTW